MADLTRRGLLQCLGTTVLAGGSLSTPVLAGGAAGALADRADAAPAALPGLGAPRPDDR
jgi:hypothetical protein